MSAPDATSVLSIVPFSGRVLIVDNRFEDPAWVNAGYGTSIDVICARNTLVRAGLLINYGVHSDDWYEPSWHVQFFDNQATEGRTDIELSGGGRISPAFAGPLTRCTVHRRETLAADNSGNIRAHGRLEQGVIEHCVMKNPFGVIRVDGEPHGVLVRDNVFFEAGPRYEGDGIGRALAEPSSSASK